MSSVDRLRDRRHGPEPGVRHRVLGRAGPRRADRVLDFEIKLWEDGTIDMLYGSNPANPGDGRTATVGIENATGTDALQFCFFESTPRSEPRLSASRRVPTGLVHGTVTDANDGLPIAGAKITPTPGGRHTTTDERRHYTLRSSAGHVHTSTATANLYEDGSATATVADDATVTDRLQPPRADGSGRPDRAHRRRRLREDIDADRHRVQRRLAPLDWVAQRARPGRRPAAAAEPRST